MRLYTKISFWGLCLGCIGSLMSMQSIDLNTKLKQLQTSLNTLEIKLKKEKKPKSGELNLSKLDQEALEILLAEAKIRGIPLHEFVMDSLLKANLQPQGGIQPQVPVVPGGPPPPPPPAPAITQLPKGFVISVTTPPGTVKKSDEDITPPSLDVILKQRGALVKTGLLEKPDVTPLERQKSDEQFLLAFKNAGSIDELIENIRALKTDPLYLKKNAITEPEKVDLSKPGSIPTTRLRVAKTPLIELLSKKNALVTRGINAILSDYMFNTKLFNPEYINILNGLIDLETNKPKKQEQREYKPWKEVLIEIINEATSLDDIMAMISKFPSKFVQEDILLPGGGKLKTKFVKIEDSDVINVNLLKRHKEEDDDKAFVSNLKKVIGKNHNQQVNKLDTLLEEYSQEAASDAQIFKVLTGQNSKSSLDLYNELAALDLPENDEARILNPLLDALTSLERTPQKIFNLLREKFRHKKYIQEGESKIVNKIEPYGLLMIILNLIDKYLKMPNAQTPEIYSALIAILKRSIKDLSEKGKVFAAINKGKSKRDAIKNESDKKVLQELLEEMENLITLQTQEKYRDDLIDKKLAGLLPQAVIALKNKDAQGFFNILGAFIANANTPGLQDKYNLFVQEISEDLKKGLAARR